MQTIAIGLVAGVLCGAVAGLLIGLMQVWSRGLRDSRLSARGHPLPRDRVFTSFHTPGAILGGLHGAAVSWFVPLGWVLASIFLLPATALVVLLIDGIFTLALLTLRRG